MLNKDLIKKSPGFSKFSFLDDEKEELRGLIRQQWLDQIAKNYPQHLNQFIDLPMDHYHEKQQLIDHGSLWTKVNRILEPDAVARIIQMVTFKNLMEALGGVGISDEEALGYGNFYWRLVRPGEVKDVGPLHADQWFWALGHGGKLDHGISRVKVWIAIYCESGETGLRVVPDSHAQKYRYDSIFSNGIRKPVLLEDESEIPFEVYESRPGDAIAFNDLLLHGGAVGGTLTRVSLEFTCLVKNF